MVNALSRESGRARLLVAALLSAGCYDLKKVDPGIELTADSNGTVDMPEVGIRGRWHVFGDQYDHPRRCVGIGHHLPESCSVITAPDPSLEFVAPVDGALCISGKVAKVVPCLADNQVECLAPPPDASIGAGGTAESATDGSETWDPESHVDVRTLGCNCQDAACLPSSGVSLAPGESCACPPPPVPFEGCKSNASANGSDDYSNMWGAGLGLDFSLEQTNTRNPLERSTWDPAKYGITGIAFDFSLTEGRDDPDFLRVEFPMLLPAGLRLPSGPTPSGPDWIGTVSLMDDSTVGQPGDLYPDSAYNPAAGDLSLPLGSTPVPSDEHPSGSPFWRDGSQKQWQTPGTRAVQRGHNVIHFDEVAAPPFSQMSVTDPDPTYVWVPSQMLGIQFHVPTRTTQADAFSFCISNVTLVRD
ncbi:MAG TPA: hypothetical protein VMI54_15675 [Polyangiaceae bacterium]|nr:hypothetical protein [Polyangiaceae bacterium]